MIKLITIILTIFLSVPAIANTKCADLFDPSPWRRTAINQAQLDPTDNLIAYLGELLEQQIIGDKELNLFIKGLEQGKLINPISESDSNIHMNAQIQRGGIEGHFKNDLNKVRLLDWALKSLIEKKRVRVKRDETREETHDVTRKMEFNLVPPGRFMMGGEFQTKKVNVTLTHQIEMMSTQVTQKHWVELMGENPSHFAKREDTTVYKVKGKSIKLQQDHPIENVTWWSVVVFANKLSEKHGLKPAYDLSGITWKKGTRAEDGKLEALDAEDGKIKINASNGDYYQAEGFRLPTEAEQEYILRAAGTENGEYHFGNNEVDLKNHAWFKDNSGGKTHPVGELKPLILNGNEFYDLHGNVWEWAWDRYKKISPKGGENPVEPNSGSHRVCRGGAWNFCASDASSAYRHVTWAVTQNRSFGFRLVRTTDVKPVKDAPGPEATE